VRFMERSEHSSESLSDQKVRTILRGISSKNTAASEISLALGFFSLRRQERILFTISKKRKLRTCDLYDRCYHLELRWESKRLSVCTNYGKIVQTNENKLVNDTTSSTRQREYFPVKVMVHFRKKFVP